MENKLRSQLNLTTFENYQDFLDRDEDPKVIDIDSKVLDEASNILVDLIELKYEPLLASSTKNS